MPHDTGVWTQPELTVALRMAIATLPPKQLQAITLWADGYSRREIARMMGVSPSTVKMHVKIAISKLRREFGVTEQKYPHYRGHVE